MEKRKKIEIIVYSLYREKIVMKVVFFSSFFKNIFFFRETRNEVRMILKLTLE